MKHERIQAFALYVFCLTFAAAIVAVSAGCGGKPREVQKALLTHAAESPLMQPTASAAAQPGYFGDEYAHAQRALRDKPIEPSAPTF